MLSFLFWNINGKDLTDTIVKLAVAHEPDVIMLAEAKLNHVLLVRELNTFLKGKVYTFPFQIDTSRVTYIVSNAVRDFRLIEDHGRMSVRAITPVLGEIITVAGVHAVSKLHRESKDQELAARDLMDVIRAIESREGHKRTLVVGDINMDPFEDGVSGADGFHAVMDPKIAAEGSREVNGREWEFMFNPMWALMGANNRGAYGTYYSNHGGLTNLYWRTFDQVLLRPSLINEFDNESLQIVTQAHVDLLTANGRPDSTQNSDHLPITFKLQQKQLRKD